LPKPFQIFVVPKPRCPPVHNLQLWRPYVAVSYPALKGHQRYANRLSCEPRTNGRFHIRDIYNVYKRKCKGLFSRFSPSPLSAGLAPNGLATFRLAAPGAFAA
jgi:hypothetical protein